MASLLAIQLRHRLEAFFGRALTTRQIWHCEEIIINFKPEIPFRYLENLEKVLGENRKHLRNWRIFYYSLYVAAKTFSGAFRRKDLVFLRGRMHRIYRQCDLMAGDGFGEKDLASILFLAEQCTDHEVEAAFTIARTYGLRTLRHVRGIILRNRAVAIQPRLSELGLDKNEKLVEEIGRWAKVKYPDVQMLRELYRGRIRNVLRGQNKFRFAWDNLNESVEEETNEPET